MANSLQKKRRQVLFIVVLVLTNRVACYEKTLRKIVRNQSKMVQKPFSDNSVNFSIRKQQNPQEYLYPGYTQMKSIIHKMQRPKISTSVDTGRSKSMFSRMNMMNEIVNPYELRMARDAITHAVQQADHSSIFTDGDVYIVNNQSDTPLSISDFTPTSKYFQSLNEMSVNMTSKENSNLLDESAPIRSNSLTKPQHSNLNETFLNKKCKTENTLDLQKKDCVAENEFLEAKKNLEPISIPDLLYICKTINEAKVDIDAQDKFSQFDIEPPRMEKGKFWNRAYENRYESLMRNSKWPSLKVILIPSSQVHSIWKQTFESIYNNTVRHIISNVVKKLQFYPNLTFSWNEVSHLSQWWREARGRSRAVLQRLISEGRLEITTGMWVETDDSMSNLFGLIHQLMEGHQWLQHFLNYVPETAWLTSSVTHSPTIPYLLSASGINNLIITNLHYSWQQYLTEYQYTDFVWVQNWDNDKDTTTYLNEALNRIGKERLPKRSVLTHYLQFNAAGFDACGPEGHVCATELNFVNDNNSLDINTFNVKEKSERLLEQYSKAGTTSSHNVVIAPLGDQFSYKLQNEIDYQYSNYERIAEFVNNNKDIYKATIEFGTSKDYFEAVVASQASFPTLKGDFVNYADITDGTPAYWTGFFTSRPQLKLLIRRLQSNLRSAEILFSFAVNYNVVKTYNTSKLLVMLLEAREAVARLQDRHVVSGTLTSKAMGSVRSLILSTVKNCWHIQEVAISLLSTKLGQNTPYLEKYVYREGEFISSFKSVTEGDQICVFNSLSHERTEVVELMTRHINIKVVDHKEKEVPIQINPIWNLNQQNKIAISSQFFKIIFAIEVPPMSIKVFKIQTKHDSTESISAIYCTVCEHDVADSDRLFFAIHRIEAGDIILENHKHRLIFDENTGFLKSVTQQSTNVTNDVVIDFGAFKSSKTHSGMFLFNTNYSNPLEDILSPFRTNSKDKIIFIISGQIATELTSIYGTLIQHTVKIFNVENNTLSNAIEIKTKLDYDVAPKNSELEIFMSIQTDVDNGSPPEITTDNNGFQYTTRTVSPGRRLESNMYPVTSMLYIQDRRKRLTVLTDHSQAATALQEGQVVMMLDRRVRYDDERGAGEGLTDSTVTYHTHYLLLESFEETFTSNTLKMPSLSAIQVANGLSYPLDIFFIEFSKELFCHFKYKPLIKNLFPCDVMMLNFRAIFNGINPIKYITKSALLTLHRLKLTCIKNEYILTRCQRKEPMRLEKIFHNVRAVYQTNLVGTNEGTPVNILNESNSPVMEIITLRVHF